VLFIAKRVTVLTAIHYIFKRVTEQFQLPHSHLDELREYNNLPREDFGGCDPVQ
jgi:hypothetical protein